MKLIVWVYEDLLPLVRLGTVLPLKLIQIHSADEIASIGLNILGIYEATNVPEEIMLRIERGMRSRVGV